MTTPEAAMRQALEALKTFVDFPRSDLESLGQDEAYTMSVLGRHMHAALSAIAALESALAAPVQAPVMWRADVCWLIELFEPWEGGNSLGFYHTGFTRLDGSSRTTNNPHEAKKYASKSLALLAIAKLEPAMRGTWTAVEHAFHTASPVQPAAPQPAEPLTRAAKDVLAERQRQIEKEGWEEKHDDYHQRGELSRAAAVYCLCAERSPSGVASELHQSRPWDFNILRAIWPRDWNFNPKDVRSNLVRAGALVLAEIERRDRASTPKAAQQEGGDHG